MNGRILIADDDSAIRTVLSQALSREGYEVRVTSNAGVADNCAAESTAASLVPRVSANNMATPTETETTPPSKKAPDTHTDFGKFIRNAHDRHIPNEPGKRYNYVI